CRLSHLTPVISGKPNREEPTPVRLVEGSHDVVRAAAGGQPDRDITGPPKRRDLPSEHRCEANVVGRGGGHGHVVRQRRRRQRLSCRRREKQLRQGNGGRGATAIAKRK